MVTLGPPGSGKSSTVETLRAKKPVLVSRKTEVADLRQLDISPDDTIQVFDEGGDDVYKITSPVFNTPKSIPMLVHDITKVDGILTNLLLRPENQVVFVLTHVDCCDKVILHRNKDLITSTFLDVIQGEIQLLEKSKIGEKEKRQRIIDHLEKQKAAFRCFPISCKTSDGVNKLTLFLQETVQKRRVYLPLTWFSFYKVAIQDESSFLLKENLLPIYRKNDQEKYNKHLESQFQQCLLYFSDVGLFLLFDNVPKLDQYVFHRPMIVVDILKALFHHDLPSTLNYNDDPLL